MKKSRIVTELLKVGHNLAVLESKATLTDKQLAKYKDLKHTWEFAWDYLLTKQERKQLKGFIK
jgi:hypothetical protein